MARELGIAGWILSGEILQEETLTLLEYPGVCAAYGVKTVELCSRFFESQDARYLNDLRSRLEDNGLQVQNIAVDMGNIAGADAAVRRTDLESLKQWFYTATAIGSKAIRINTGQAEDESAVDRVIEGYCELTEVAAHSGVRLLMENHGGVSSSPQGVTRILDGVSSEWFGTCPDTGNFSGEDWEEGIAALLPRAFTVHIKLFSYDKSGRQAWEGRDGDKREFDLKSLLDTMDNAGYKGPLCIEKGASATARDSIRDSLAYLREMIAN